MENHLKTKGKELKLTTLGFTLVELITVILVIAIIALITIKTISSKINSSKNNAYDIQIKNIKDAAKKYVLDDKLDDKYHLNTTCITIKQLQDKGYLKKDSIINPKTDEDFDVQKNYIKIQYDFEQNQYEYIFTDNCISNIIIPASEKIISSNNINILNKNDGLYETTDSYVYRGTNPNNYLLFNNKMWRIISIDKETMLIKIINLEDNQKQITTNGIIKDLNDDFEAGTTYNDNSKEKINYNSKWNSNLITELGTSLSIKSIEKQSNSFNTISLLTVGEYIDASLNKTCYKENKCSSYLSVGKNYWLLNKNANNTNWYVSSENKLLFTSLDTQLYNVYPCLYLNLDVQFDGDGTSTNPYKIK